MSETTPDSSIASLAADVSALHAYLDTELHKERRQRLIFLIVMGVLTALVLGYLMWVNSIVKRYVNPPDIAQLVESETKRALPGVAADMTRSLKEFAPELAENLKRQVLNDVLPELRLFAEKQLTTLAGEAIQVAEARMVEVVTAVVKHNKAAILEAATYEGTLQPNALSLALNEALQLEIQRNVRETPDEPIYRQLEASKEQLRGIERKLRALAAKTELTRVESLEKRFIQSWMAFIANQTRATDGAPNQP